MSTLHPRRALRAAGCAAMCAAALALATATASTAHAQGTRATLTGVAMDSALAPLPGVQVSIIGTRIAAVTDDSGRFALRNIPPALQVVSVKRVGYQPRMFDVRFARGESLDVEVQLEPLPQQLPIVRVEENAGFKPAHLGYTTKFDGFYVRREKSGAGHFFDRSDFAKIGVRDLIDVFRQVPGVKIVSRGFDKYVHMNGCPSPGVYLDGVHAPNGVYILSDMRLADVEAVEIYKTPTGMPAEAKAGCGAIFVWMKSR